MDGIVNVYKEADYTSHDVVAVIRKIFNQKKVGHTGTLDPMATGVLPVCLGSGTKLADYIMSGEKTYRAKVTLGISTNTDDAWGEETGRADFTFDPEAIKSAAESFTGEYSQIPPMYSAIRVNGQKLYTLAREGIEVERQARTVTIHYVRLIELLPPDSFTIEVRCSKGTYIRTLCVDIGKKLCTLAHMGSLVRVASGGFTAESAHTLAEIKEYVDAGMPEKIVIPLKQAMSDYNMVTVKKSGEKLMRNGCRIYGRHFSSWKNEPHPGEIVAGLAPDGEFIGIYEVQEGKDGFFIKPVRLLI